MRFDTLEQTRIGQIRSGINLINANAGTGKTDTLARLAAEIYLYEERRLFPDVPGHVDGDRQRQILAQIMPVTFTRAAAAEFNTRILDLLQQRGIPPPLDRWGRPYALARTLDSYIYQWFRNPRVFFSWLKIDPDFQLAIKRALEHLAPAALAVLNEREGSRPYSLFCKWGWFVGDDVQDFVLDCLIRESEDLPRIAGVPPVAGWERLWLDWLGSFVPSEPAPGAPHRGASWGEGFWAGMLAPFKEHQRSMQAMEAKYREGRCAAAADLKTVQEQLHQWERIQTTKREFFSVYELARAKGYHPQRHKTGMLSTTVMRELAASDYLYSFGEFHRLALRFYSAKVLFLFLDHTDLLNAFVEIVETFPALLEQQLEYPRYGIRAKNTLFDETQDNNGFQNRILVLWQAHPGVPFCTVACGDVKQAIYGWKGASSYGFANMIARAKQRDPDRLFTLSCSFRSLPEIVEFGNAIVTTLPHYKDNVVPSTTIYTEPGKIVVLPPLPDDQAEAEMVMRQVNRILATTSDSIMVLHRNNLWQHPIHDQLRALNTPRLQFMTIHRSKGLQADHVFVLGLTAGLLPDIRSSYTQEVNLFYVACTRARKMLYLCAPYTRKAIDKATGMKYAKDVGPSVFFARLPELRLLADEAGWPTPMISMGETTTRDAVEMHLARTQAREASLRGWWQKYFPEIPVVDNPDEEPTNEAGAKPVAAEIKLLGKRTIWEDGAVRSFAEGINAKAMLASPEFRTKLYGKLRSACIKNGQVPRLGREEFIVGLKSNWIIKPTGGRIEFARPFITWAMKNGVAPERLTA